MRCVFLLESAKCSSVVRASCLPLANFLAHQHNVYDPTRAFRVRINLQHYCGGKCVGNALDSSGLTVRRALASKSLLESTQKCWSIVPPPSTHQEGKGILEGLNASKLKARSIIISISLLVLFGSFAPLCVTCGPSAALLSLPSFSCLAYCIRASHSTPTPRHTHQPSHQTHNIRKVMRLASSSPPKRFLH